MYACRFVSIVLLLSAARAEHTCPAGVDCGPADGDEPIAMLQVKKQAVKKSSEQLEEKTASKELEEKTALKDKFYKTYKRKVHQPPPTSACATTKVSVDIVPDRWPEETTWQVYDTDGNVFFEGDGLRDTHGEGCATDGGTYTFRIQDSYGDGICCSYGHGSYKITVTPSTPSPSTPAPSSSKSCQAAQHDRKYERVCPQFDTAQKCFEYAPRCQFIEDGAPFMSCVPTQPGTHNENQCDRAPTAAACASGEYGECHMVDVNALIQVAARAPIVIEGTMQGGRRQVVPVEVEVEVADVEPTPVEPVEPEPEETRTCQAAPGDERKYGSLCANQLSEQGCSQFGCHCQFLEEGEPFTDCDR